MHKSNWRNHFPQGIAVKKIWVKTRFLKVMKVIAVSAWVLKSLGCTIMAKWLHAICHRSLRPVSKWSLKKQVRNTDSCWAPKKARVLFKKITHTPKKGTFSCQTPCSSSNLCKKRHFGPLPGDSAAVTRTLSPIKRWRSPETLGKGHFFTHHPKKVTSQKGHQSNCQVQTPRLSFLSTNHFQLQRFLLP